ncbi:MAG: hypothetical protein RIS43_625 [Actinomycetota bacterium]|jgi:uncharacterized membrane protein
MLGFDGIISFLVFATTLFAVFAAAVGFFDAARRPSAAFEFIGRGTKAMWMGGLAVACLIMFARGLFGIFGIISLIGTIVYHVDQKPKLAEVMRPKY